MAGDAGPLVTAPIRATLRSLIDVMAPRDPELWTAELRDRVLTQAIDSVNFLPQAARLPFRAGFWALEWGGLIMAPRPGRLSRLRGRARRVYVERWEDAALSPMRDFLKALKAVIMMAYYEQPEVMDLLGYHPQRYVDDLKARYGDRSEGRRGARRA